MYVYGKRFGAQRGSATVTVGGGEVASYRIWGQQNAVTKYLDLIVVQLGANAKTGDLVVHTPNGDSNPIPFVVRPGNLYFVSPSGSDSNPGTFDRPWATPVKAKKSIKPGDIVYFRAGTWTKEEDYATIVNLTVSGARDRPLAFVGYPGEVAFLDNANSTAAVYNWGPDVLSHWVIAEMKFRANYASLRFEGGTTEDIRVVGCDISSTGNSVSMNVEHPAKMYRVYGNNMHDNGTGAQKAYSLYFGGYGAQSDIDIGWNELHDNPLGKGIQVYGHRPGDKISNLRIHDNVIYNNGMSGMIVGGNDGKTDFVVDASIYNNLIFKNGNRHPNWQYHGIELTSNSGKGGRFLVYNNTFYDNGAPHGRVSGGSEIHVNIGIGQAVFTNNIFYADAGASTYYTYEYGATETGISGSNNVYFGKGNGPTWDKKPIHADPQFVDPQNRDFHLKAGSPAIDAGVPTNATRDFDGIQRPYGSAFDIGAFEVAAGTPPPSPPLPPAPCTRASPREASGFAIRAPTRGSKSSSRPGPHSAAEPSSPPWVAESASFATRRPWVRIPCRSPLPSVTWEAPEGSWGASPVSIPRMVGRKAGSV